MDLVGYGGTVREFGTRRILEKSLLSLVTNEIGAERWKILLRHLVQIEEKTGGMLRRSPRGADRQGRGDDETSPFLLFAPDQDRDGREFASVAGRDLLCVDRNEENIVPCRYTISPENDAQWWKQLSNRQKGIVISVLERILRALGPEDRPVDLYRGDSQSR